MAIDRGAIAVGIEIPAETLALLLLKLKVQANPRLRDGKGRYIKSASIMELTDRQLSSLANRAVFEIKKRTNPDSGYGLDFEEKPFAKYSKKYAKKKHKTVRQAIDRARVNLVGFKAKGSAGGTGGLMLASLAGSAQSGAARVHFSNVDAARIANFHNSLKPRKKIPLRRFLDFGHKTKSYENLAQMAMRFLITNIEEFWRNNKIQPDGRVTKL